MSKCGEMVCPGCKVAILIAVFEYAGTYFRTLYEDAEMGGQEDESHGKNFLKEIRCGEGCGWKAKNATRYVNALRKRNAGSGAR